MTVKRRLLSVGTVCCCLSPFKAEMANTQHTNLCSTNKQTHIHHQWRKKMKWTKQITWNCIKTIKIYMSPWECCLCNSVADDWQINGILHDFSFLCIIKWLGHVQPRHNGQDPWGQEEEDETLSSLLGDD